MLNLAFCLPLSASSWTAVFRAQQPGPGLCPARRLCPSPGRDAAGGAAAGRYVVTHSAAVTDL